MTRTINQLLWSILCNPKEDAARLVYADCLEETGNARAAQRAEFIRVQVKLAQIGGHCHNYSFGLNSCPCDFCRADGLTLKDQETALWPSAVFHIYDETRALMPAEMTVYRHGEQPTYQTKRSEAYARRGFIDSITCTCREWLDYGPLIMSQHPVTEINLKDMIRFHGGQPCVEQDTLQGIYHTAWPNAPDAQGVFDSNRVRLEKTTLAAALKWARREARIQVKCACWGYGTDGKPRAAFACPTCKGKGWVQGNFIEEQS